MKLLVLGWEVLECGEFDLLVSAGTVAAALGKSAALELLR